MLVLSSGIGPYEIRNHDDKSSFAFFLRFLISDLHDDVGSIHGLFDFEYGYEFRRESSFSYGVSVSPLVPMFIWDRSLDNTFNKSGEDNSSNENNNQFKTRFVSFIGVFGNIKINDSFLISIEGKGLILAWDYFIGRTLLKKEVLYAFHPLFPIPSIAVKGKYFF